MAFLFLQTDIAFLTRLWWHCSKEKSPGCFEGRAKKLEPRKTKVGRNQYCGEQPYRSEEEEEEEQMGWCLERSLRRAKLCGAKAWHLGRNWDLTLGDHLNFILTSFPTLLGFLLLFPSHVSEEGVPFLFSLPPFYLYVGFNCFPTLLYVSVCVDKYMHLFINSVNILSASSQPGIGTN